MKKRGIACKILCSVILIIWVLIIIALFMGCTLSQKESVEVIRCPVIDADTVRIPDWDE